MKKIISVILMVLLGLLLWYLFIKPYDYSISIVRNTAPGTMYQGVQDWVEYLDRKGEGQILETATTPYSNIDQILKIGDSLIHFNWEIKSISDSTSKITVRVKDLNNSPTNRVKNIFGTPPLKNIFITKIRRLKKGLDSHLKSHRVTIDKEGETPAQFYAYIPIKSSLEEKARNMIANNGGILGWLRENGIVVVGKPTLEVTSWDIAKDSIQFNYMFPIKERDSFPEHSKFRFKLNSSKKALKATYNGNYRTSDRAWFALLEYAKRNNIAVENTPIEFFFNNPMLGGNELEWKTEIYMPLKE